MRCNFFLTKLKFFVSSFIDEFPFELKELCLMNHYLQTDGKSGHIRAARGNFIW